MDWYNNTQFSDPDDDIPEKESGISHKFLIELHGFSDIESVRRMIADAIGEQFILRVDVFTEKETELLNSATSCPGCGSNKLGIHSIRCPQYRPPCFR